MPRHSTCKRSPLCPLSPRLYLRRVNLEVNDISTVFHDWLGLLARLGGGGRGRVWGEPLLTLEVGREEGKGPTLPPRLALLTKYLWERDLQVAATGAVRMVNTFTGSRSSLSPLHFHENGLLLQTKSQFCKGFFGFRRSPSQLHQLLKYWKVKNVFLCGSMVLNIWLRKMD